MDVYNSDHGPFLYITQYKLATHLVTMDIETFSQLAESLPEQDIKVCVILLQLSKHDLPGDNCGEHRSVWLNPSCANV